MDNLTGELKERAHKYFSIILAALIVAAIAVAGFIYSVLRTTPEDLVTESVEVSEGPEGIPVVNPSGSSVPDHPPYVSPPTTPPPE